MSNRDLGRWCQYFAPSYACLVRDLGVTLHSSSRLQNSPYFCVFTYARAVKQKVWILAPRARKTLAPRFTDFWSDFEKKPTVLQSTVAAVGQTCEYSIAYTRNRNSAGSCFSLPSITQEKEI